MVRVRLGKSLRIVNWDLLRFPSFHKLLNYISNNDVDLIEVKRLLEEVNRDLRGRGLHIQIRKAAPWDRKADYRLILRHKKTH